MKKIIFLSLSIFGMTNLANAWTAKYPQIKTSTGGKTTFICKSQNDQICMEGVGSAPFEGQACSIYVGDQRIYGRVVSVGKLSDEPVNPVQEPVIQEVVAETDMTVEVIAN